MKKVISVLMCAALAACSIFAMAGCTKQNELKSDIVLITDGGHINDDGYNQSAWEGISQFADENVMSCRYYQPVLDENGDLTVENIDKYVSLAADNGAQYIVLPGEDFAVPAFELAGAYPDVKFILLDAIPHAENDNTHAYLSNVMSVKFDALQSGVLAGYIAAASGHTELGYFGEFDSESSANYGAGFVQGAAMVADSKGIPVTVDWAEYDSAILDYDYNFTVTACYEKIEDTNDKVFNVKVENGVGTGTYKEGSNVTITANPAPLGKEFEKWEVKSDTKGVKDKKVNISSSTKSSMNLLVEECDCTITAVYKDIEGDVVTLTTMDTDGKTPYLEQSVAENSQCDIKAPVAPASMVFDHWECTVADAVEDETSAQTKVNITSQDITVTPVYAISSTPTFNVTVATGEGGNGESTGTGSYLAEDLVEISAAVPAEGYMFSHWSNEDAYGHSTGISMENEYCMVTSFEMVDRYASLCEAMYNHGATMIFNGGNSKADSAMTAKMGFDYDLGVIAAGENNKDAYSTIIKNFGEAVKDCLAEYKGGSVFVADCSNNGIYASFVPEDEEIKAEYDKLYETLANDKATLIMVEGGAGSEFCRRFVENKLSKCLTLNAWFDDEVVIELD